MRSIGWDPAILGNPNFPDSNNGGPELVLNSTIDYGSYEYSSYEDTGYLMMKCEN